MAGLRGDQDKPGESREELSLNKNKRFRPVVKSRPEFFLGGIFDFSRIRLDMNENIGDIAEGF